MTISQKQYLNHGNQTQFFASMKPMTCIRIPKPLIESRSSILKLLPFQKDSSIMGNRLFWTFLLTFMQVEHYDINFTKNISLMKQMELSSTQKQEEFSEDVMSICQSIKIRSRKVSFGVVNTIEGTEQKEKKSNQVNNVWMIVNNDDQLKLNKIKQRQEKLHQLVKKIKLLVYEQARKIDQKSHSGQNSQPKYSISTVKALSILFPKNQSKTKETLYQQKRHIHTLLQLLGQSDKQSQSRVFKSHANDLMRVLGRVAKEKILNKSSNGQNPLKNSLSLLQYFGFQQGKDFHLISSSLQDQNVKELCYDESGRQSLDSMNTSTSIGIDFKNGFFKTFLSTQGYIMTIDIDKIQGINQSVHQQFRNSLAPPKSQQQVYQPSSTLQSDPSTPVSNQSHFQFSTPSQFISRYNKRYFKNQRMLYKQKSRVENRFIQHQVDSLLSPDNYDGGYKILINSNHKSDRNSNRDFNQNPREKQEVRNDLGQEEQNQLQDEINGLFGDSEQQNLVQVQQQIEDYRKAAIRERNRNNFFLQENHSTLASSKQVDSEIFNKVNTTPLESQLNKPETQTGLYTREDFWISDDEILDDIERVLI